MDVTDLQQAFGDKELGPLTMDKAELTAIRQRVTAGVFTPADLKALLIEVDIMHRACYHYATQMGRWVDKKAPPERRGRPRGRATIQ